MRPIKTSILTVLAAVVATALVGTAPAMAEGTALCKVNEEPCKTKATLEKEKFATPTENQVRTLNLKLTPKEVWIYETAKLSPPVKCLEVSFEGQVEALGTSQAIKPKVLTFKKCGTNIEHTNCVVTAQTLPTIQVTKYAKNFGLVEVEGGILEVKCTIDGQFLICANEMTMSVIFEGKGIGNGNGMVKEEEALLKPWGAPCDDEEGEAISGLLEPTEPVYITG